MYLTITHLEPDYLKPGKELTLRKDHANQYDDEAIAVLDGNAKIGYTANSCTTVARGTYSAGRLYDKIQEEASCRVMFVMEDCAIAEVIPETLEL